MKTLVARSLRPWKQDPTESIRFGLPTTFPEGDVPVTQSRFNAVSQLTEIFNFLFFYNADEKRRKTSMSWTLSE